MRRLLPLVLFTLLGCDQVFGLDGREPPADAPPVLVTGRALRQWVTNDATGLPVTHSEPHAPGTITLAVHVGNASRVPVPVEPDGTFSFVRPDEDTPYRLQIVADGRRTELQHTAANLLLKANTVGRPNDQRVPVTLSTYLTLPAAGGAARLASTGIWTNSAVYSDGLALNVSVDWKTATPLSGRRGLLSQTHHDRLYYFGFVDRAPGHSTIGSVLEIPDIELSDGLSQVFAGPMKPAADNSCVHVTGNRMQELERFTAATPASKDPYTDWTIQAVPEPAFGANGAIEIASHRPTSGITIDEIVNFPNPIRGSSLLLTMGVSSFRTVTVPGAVPVLVASAIRSYRPVASTATCGSPIDGTTAAGIPGDATFDGVLLAQTDDAVIMPGLRETLQLTWSLAAPGPVDRYTASLFEFVEDPQSGITTSRFLREVATVEPSVIFDAALFVPGSYYLFVITTSTGFPDARNGDMLTITYPLDQVATHTGLFQVQ